MIRSPHNTFVVIHTEPPFWFSDQHLFWFSESYPIDDVIGCEEVVTGWFWRTEVTRVWLIEHGPSNSLLKRSIIVSGDLRKRFQHDLTEKTTTGKIKKKSLFCHDDTRVCWIYRISFGTNCNQEFAETKRPKRVLVMINPIGGNGTARKDFGDIVEPVFRLSGISMDTICMWTLFPKLKILRKIKNKNDPFLEMFLSVIVSERSGHMIEVAQTYDFTGIDG